MLLLVGAGLSAWVGYPTLDGYAKNLVEDCDFTVPAGVPTDDASAVVQAVKEHLQQDGRLSSFYRHLERSFDPSVRDRDYDSVHRLLVGANFRAIATTNYDSVLEDAARADRNRAEEFDLCADRRTALEFVRSTSAGRHRASILHVHGYFRNPRQLVITTRDYFWRYGPYEVVNASGDRAFRWRETLNVKFLWWLFTTYPVLFVGFSMRDLALRHILQVVDDDFDRGGDLDHYAIMGAQTDDEEATITEDLSRYGVEPIFYRVNPPTGPGRRADHGELEPLLADLCRERRGRTITNRMLA